MNIQPVNSAIAHIQDPTQGQLQAEQGAANGAAEQEGAVNGAAEQETPAATVEVSVAAKALDLMKVEGRNVVKLIESATVQAPGGTVDTRA